MRQTPPLFFIIELEVSLAAGPLEVIVIRVPTDHVDRLGLGRPARAPSSAVASDSATELRLIVHERHFRVTMCTLGSANSEGACGRPRPTRSHGTTPGTGQPCRWGSLRMLTLKPPGPGPLLCQCALVRGPAQPEAAVNFSALQRAKPSRRRGRPSPRRTVATSR